MLKTLFKSLISSWQHKREGLANSELLAPLLGISVVLITFFVSGLVVLIVPDSRYVFLIALLLLPLAVYSLYLIYTRVNQNLLEPLSHLRSWAMRMRSGKLSSQIPVVGHGEYALLAQDINKLGDSFRSLSRDMDSNVEEQTRSLERKSNMLEILYDVAASSNYARDIHELITRNLSTLADIVSAPYATVRLLTDDDQLKLIASKGLKNTIDKSEEFVPIEHCLCAMNFSEELIECSCDNKFCGALLGKSTKSGNIAGVIAIPLRYKNRTLGLYNLFLTEKYHEDWEIDNLLINIGRHLSIAIEKAKLDDEAKRITLIHERTMLAHELHDSLAQTLASLRFRVSLINKILREEGNESALPEVLQLKSGLDEANNELRELLVHFRVHMDERGLAPALQNLVERFKSESGIAVFLQNECVDINLSPLYEVQVLHIIQESLANIRKHSQAEHVRVLLRCTNENNYHVLIEDDGIGINTETIDGLPGEHVGLTIMQERARRIGGQVSIESETGEGTRVELDFQFDPKQTLSWSELSEISRTFASKSATQKLM